MTVSKQQRKKRITKKRKQNISGLRPEEIEAINVFYSHINDELIPSEPLRLCEMVCGFFRFFQGPSLELPSDSGTWKWTQSGSSVFSALTNADEVTLYVKLKKISPRTKSPKKLSFAGKAWIYEIYGLDKLTSFPAVVYAIWVKYGIDLKSHETNTEFRHFNGDFTVKCLDPEEFRNVCSLLCPESGKEKNITINARLRCGHLIDPGELYDYIVNGEPLLGKKRKRTKIKVSSESLLNLPCGKLMCTCQISQLTIL